MPFCNKCGTEVPENVNFCQKCGNALQSGQEPNQSSDTKGIFRRIIEGCALLLCVLFFVCPLKCSGGDVAYTGWDMAAGYGIVKSEPLVFVLIIIPIALLILALIGKPFILLRNVSIAGLIAKIGFLIAAYMNIKKSGFELTGANLFILGIYIGLVWFTQYCVNFFNEAKKNLKKDHKEEHKQLRSSFADARNWKTYIRLMSIIFGVVFILAVAYMIYNATNNPSALAEKVIKGSFVDSRDGKKYKTVKVGDETWMAENLNYDAKGSKCYGNEESNCQKYGRLYDWKTAKSACPGGWRLPTIQKWQTLVDFVGGDKVAGSRLKASSGWKDWGEGNGIDAIGFSALPGGVVRGEFMNGGTYGYWWSSTSEDSNNAYSLVMGSPLKEVMIEWSESMIFLLSVRCSRPDWLDKY